MKKAYRQALIERINRKEWWHVPPVAPKAYQKRGKFYSSTFGQAEFWGRPNDKPERVRIQNPVVGDEDTVWRILFGKLFKIPGLDSPHVIAWRFKTDAKMRKAALAKGYDAIVILSGPGFKNLRTQGRLPISMELNFLQRKKVP